MADGCGAAEASVSISCHNRRRCGRGGTWVGTRERDGDGGDDDECDQTPRIARGGRVARSAARYPGPAGDARADRLRASAGRPVPPLLRLPDRSRVVALAGDRGDDRVAGARARFAVGHRAGLGRLLRADLGLRRGLRGAVQRPDAGQADARHPGRLRPRGADHRGAGGAPQPGGGRGWTRSRSAFCSGLRA